MAYNSSVPADGPVASAWSIRRAEGFHYRNQEDCTMLAVIRQSIDGLLSAIHRFMYGTSGRIQSWLGQVGEFWRQGANRWFLIVVALLVMFLLVQLRRQRR